MIVLAAPAVAQAAPTGVCGVVSVVNPAVGAGCSAAGGAVSSGAGSVVSSVSGDALQSFAKDFATTISHILKLLATAWESIPSPFTSSSGGAAQDGTTVWLGGELRWVVGACLILGTIAACIITMVHAGRGKQIGDDVERMSTALIRVILVSAAGAAFIGLFMAIGDGFATWILQQAGTSWNGANASSFTAMAATDPPLVIVLGLLVAIAVFIQIVVVAGIAVILPILVGLWPCSAALSSTEGGSAVWKRHTGWIAAAILFKPVAAIIYAVAFKMMSGTVKCPAGVTCDAQSVSELSLLFGLLLLIFAVLALPALMRLLVPAVAAVGGISGGEAIGAGVSLATGAALIASSGGAGAAAGGAADTGSMGTMGSPGSDGPSGGEGPSKGGGNGSSPGGNGNGGVPDGGQGSPSGGAGVPSGEPVGAGVGSSPGGGSSAAGGESGSSGGGWDSSSGANGARTGVGLQTLEDGASDGASLAEGAVPSNGTGEA